MPRFALPMPLALVLCLGLPFAMACAAPRPVAEQPAEGLELWSQRHPEASRELGEWVKAHPQAAHLFFDWDGHHPERSKEFVTWTLAHPELNIDGFAFSHLDWEYFDKIVEKHRPAAMAFMSWARRHRAAAESLMNHPRGLEWAGHHLYQDAWVMKSAR